MTYDEALALAIESNEDDNPIFVIDKNLRTVTVPKNFVLGVYNDKDVQVIPFLMPRYYNNIDLSDFLIRVNYVNSNGDGDIYLIMDKVVSEDTINFNWVVGRTAFLYKGNVNFVVCFIELDGLGEVAREFNTTKTTARVLEGLEIDDPASDQEFIDILAQIQATLVPITDEYIENLFS